MSEFKHINTVLIANRGEIACRIINTCQSYGLKAVAVYSKEDNGSKHVSSADEAILLPGVGVQAYINMNSLVEAAKRSNADVVIPGYGFLSESPEFAKLLEENNILFAGPSNQNIEQFGLKHVARSLAIDADVPVVPGTGLIDNFEEAKSNAERIGYPLMLKATAGGGGMGLKVCEDETELKENFEQVKSRGKTLFSNTGVFIEKYVKNSRHIEVQLFGNGLGDVMTFGERECSIQRRHQKVIEETPSTFVDENLRKKLCTCASVLAKSIKYKSAGTIEFLVDDDTGDFYFLEMNTRLQVEHGITELVYGIDLVYLMLLQAEYEAHNSGIPRDVLFSHSTSTFKDGILQPNGHAIEVRVYAENPVKDFAPAPGILHYAEFPIIEGIRVDHWIGTGTKISPYFDPLLAKVMVWDTSRIRAAEKLINYLSFESKVHGPTTNIEYCVEILKSSSFKSGRTLTSFLSSFQFNPNILEFEEAGAYTTIQDMPGRITLNGGIPESGPVDPLSFQIANIIVGNDENVEALEITLSGPTIKFHTSSVIALAGAQFEFTVNGENVPSFTSILIQPGDIVIVGNALTTSASKAYLSIKGGFPQVANYLGSKSCTPTLNLGGHQGRTILPSDCLAIQRIDITDFECYEFPESLRPCYNPEVWEIRTVGGPHDTNDILSKEGLENLYSDTFSVNLNSNRGGTRLDGAPIKFGRESGGDGGSHPSNIMEYVIPRGALSSAGNQLVAYGPDGATLSGFVCLGVIISVDFWKLGQPGVASKVKFKRITYDDSLKLKKQRTEFIKFIKTRPKVISTGFTDELNSYQNTIDDTILYQLKTSSSTVTFRQAGEKAIIVEHGLLEFDLEQNGKRHILKIKLEEKLHDHPGILKTECATNAYTVFFDSDKISRDYLMEILIKLEQEIPSVDDLKIPSRIYRFPLAFDHEAIRHCIERYIKSQRPHAPYLPDNTEFLMRSNNLKTIEEFKKQVLAIPQIVLAVSFVCALPLLVHPDPRCRLMSSKYNPPRTFTPAGALGTAAVTNCVYSVDSPGGYMVWGLTLPNAFWDTFGQLKNFGGNSWYLKNFDQIEFYEVSGEELDKLNNDLITGNYCIDFRDEEFEFKKYSKFLKSVQEEANLLNQEKLKSIAKLIIEENASLQKWEADKLEAKTSKGSMGDLVNDPDVIKITSPLAANVFKIHAKPQDRVTKDDVLIILEAMKMEIPVRIKKNSVKTEYEVLAIVVEEGDVITPGDVVALVKAT